MWSCLFFSLPQSRQVLLQARNNPSADEDDHAIRPGPGGGVRSDDGQPVNIHRLLLVFTVYGLGIKNILKRSMKRCVSRCVSLLRQLLSYHTVLNTAPENNPKQTTSGGKGVIEG